MVSYPQEYFLAEENVACPPAPVVRHEGGIKRIGAAVGSPCQLYRRAPLRTVLGDDVCNQATHSLVSRWTPVLARWGKFELAGESIERLTQALLVAARDFDRTPLFLEVACTVGKKPYLN